MNNLLCLPLFVLIFIFDPVINSKGEHIHVSFTTTKQTWFQARQKCPLIGNEHVIINIPTVNSDPMWTGDSARYLPWVEYVGCYGLIASRKLIRDSINVRPGTQLKECLLHCKQSSFIGLKQSNCVCLHYLELASDYLNNKCNLYPAPCQGDKTAFCGSNNQRYISVSFSIYKKVNVTEKLDDGNCLAVDGQKDALYYVAHNCTAKYFQICLNAVNLGMYQQNMENKTWIDSFNICQPSYMLSRYSLVYNNANFTKRGTYWLSDTRRWIHGTSTNPEFCIAARVKEDGHLERFPIRCETKLHGLCETRKIPDHEKNGNEMTSSDDQPPINKVLLISVIAATSLVIIVAVVIVIFCIRMKRLQSTSSQNQIVVAGKNVVYAQVDRSRNQDKTIDEATGKSPVEDTYDHMDHRCMSQVTPKEESNYDTMSKVGIVEENDYSHTNETDRERQCFVDASSEYSHVTVVAKPENRE